MAVPQDVKSHTLNYFFGTRDGAMVVCRDSLTRLMSDQALVGQGQCACLHCMKDRGSCNKREGRRPLLAYARACEIHQTEHSSAYDLSQWLLSPAGLERVYTEEIWRWLGSTRV